jgi:hypothetical protein
MAERVPLFVVMSFRARLQRNHKRHALIVVLGYSRYMWLQYYERQTMAVVMRGLESVFRYFGGVPSELLFDQMKAVIVGDRRPDGGRLVENPEFLRFSVHWGFRIRACRPYRARTKGKVERLVSYIRRNFFYGRSFASDDDLNAQVLGWLDTVANVRIHGTLRERPADRFESERLRLMALAPWGLPSAGSPGRKVEPGWGRGDPSACRSRAPAAVGVRPDRGRNSVRPPSRRERIAAQIALRNGRRLEAAMRSSRLPYVRTLDGFDFS